MYRWRVQGNLRRLNENAAALLKEGHAELSARTREAAHQREQFAKERSSALAETLTEGLSALQDSENAINAREAHQNKRSAHIESSFETVNSLQQATRRTRRETQESYTSAKALTATRRRALETQSGLLTADLHQEFIKTQVDAVSLQARRRGRLQAEELQKQQQGRARRLLTTAMQRYNGVGHLERIQNSIAIPNRQTFDSWLDPNGKAHRALTDEIPFELESDPDAGHLIVRGDNPLAREIARRALRQIANRSINNPQKIRTIARQCTEEVEREVQNAGQRAIRTLRIGQVHPEIQGLVGRLKFRLSYSQNQLKHAVEVGYLAGLMAEEAGLDVRTARRGGLLHDIGKAMTHDHEGSHAVLGAEVARRCGEAEIIANAIGAHHNDEPMESPIAHIVTAADAISGARPGARRETATLYLERVTQIQEIARRHPGIERVDVMNGGREVRVIVESQDQGDVENIVTNIKNLPDSELHPLAQRIARALEEEVVFPGQVKVTVIRESKSVSIAR